jgi:hypothetical protein
VGTFRLLQADEATRYIPVIFLTAKVMAADRRQLAELGVTAVLAKPFDPLTLGSRIGEMLGWPAGAAAEGSALSARSAVRLFGRAAVYIGLCGRWALCGKMKRAGCACRASATGTDGGGKGVKSWRRRRRT